MNTKISKFLTVLLLINILIFTVGIVPLVYCANVEVDPVLENDISIDGNLEDWGSISPYSIELRTKSSSKGLGIYLMCAQDKNNLYLAIDFELEKSAVERSEFLGVLISSSDDDTNLTDARIVNMSYLEGFNFTDYYIDNHNFIQDSDQDGEGIGTNRSISNSKNKLVYEFKIPLNDVNGEDVNLEKGSAYAFNISQGNEPLYPQGIVRSNSSVVIRIKNPSSEPISSDDFSKLGSFIAAVVIFTIVGVSYVYYIFRIFLLKKKMERIRG